MTRFYLEISKDAILAIIRRNYPHGDEDGLAFPSQTLDTELLDSLSEDLFFSS